MRSRAIPEATVARLPIYLRALLDLAENQRALTISSEEVGGLIVRHLDELKECVAETGLCIGIIATPPASAQEVAERFVDAGIKSILSFAPAVVNVPPDVSLRKVDLAMELQILAFYQQRTQAIATAREAHRRLEETGHLSR